MSVDMEKKDLEPGTDTIEAEAEDNGVLAQHVLQHEIDADEALKAVSGEEEDVEIDDETNRRLLKKIDWNIMPVGNMLGF